MPLHLTMVMIFMITTTISEMNMDDANGNVTKDVNKGIIGLTYNHLNLPKEIYFLKDNKLDYYYDAAGNKLRHDVIYAKNLIKRTDFISNFVMVNNAPAWINFDEL